MKNKNSGKFSKSAQELPQIKNEEFNVNFFNKNCRIGTGSSSMSICENCQRSFLKSAEEQPQIKISQKLNDFCGNQRSFLKSVESISTSIQEELPKEQPQLNFRKNSKWTLTR